jgi:two-component SAPR family response regulator
MENQNSIWKMRFLIILLFFLFFRTGAFGQSELNSGLYFSSHEVVQDKRTSLNLTPFQPFKFSGGFTLEMDASFRKRDGFYGYIFRIIGDETINIDLVSNTGTRSSNFSLVLKDNVLFSFNWADIPNGGSDRWIKIIFEMNVNERKIAVSFNGFKKETKIDDIATLKAFNMVFGACRIRSFQNTDVSPMSLKDIRIFDAKKQLVKEWKLSKHHQNVVYDEVSHTEAHVENPIWIIDSHVKWKKLKALTIDGLLGITMDEENGRVFLINNHAVFVFSNESFKIDTIQFSGGAPYPAMGKQIIYNKFTNELWSYNFDQNEINKFSFNTRAWSKNYESVREPDFWHHNKFITPTDSSLVTIFGYGHYTYKRTIQKYNLKLQKWDIDQVEGIEPRYLSSFGFLNNTEMLVFGGYGSKTGRQELSPEIYYDLYSFNLQDYSFRKLWTLNTPSKPFVPCEALIPDQKAGIFYTLIYDKSNFATSLHLAKFMMAKNEYQLFNDSIPYNFLDTESWCSLFLDKKTNHLLALTSHNKDVAIYSIAYPPLMSEDVSQVDKSKRKWYLWVIIFVGLVLAGFTFYFLKKKKETDITKREIVKKKAILPNLNLPSIIPIEPLERKTVSSIYFIGGFQIYNSSGNDITSAFSPTLKQLFIYIFLNSVNQGKGVSSSKLDEVLWYDKIGESARNNRNVNISKLRTVLEDIGGIEVVAENSIWKIKMEDSVFCDYTEILQLLSKHRTGDLIESDIHKLIALLSIGDFMQSLQNEWIDRFKSQFTNQVVDGLSPLLNEELTNENMSLQYHIAECILIYDQLNDEAFALKCSIVYKLGKVGMAKNLYDIFCREYKMALGIDYPVSFNDIVK